MSSGGARARSGPAPDPHALRRDGDAGEWVTLPAGPCKTKAPTWPLPKQTPRERTLWARLWKLPQAAMWHRNHQDLEVALYVRRLGEAELPGAPVALGTLVRQLGDGLGLSLTGLRAQRWVIEGTADAAAISAARTGGAARERFKVLPGGG